MRIVRPGSVVGPQQQYMYVKQLEWAKWAAVDEMRRAEAQAAAAIAAASVITPATPPAEADDEQDAMEVNSIIETVVVASLAPSTPKSKAIPPVTPSRHVNAATARAQAITPPGQPRKTPVAKRTADVAAVDESDDESEDELNALPVLNLGNRTRSKLQSATTARATGRRLQPASEQRPTRITRSTAVTNGVRKPAPVGGTSITTGRTAGGQSPNKIPRLTTNTTNPTTVRSTTAMGTRARPTSPTPSRLPTLAASRRNNATNGAAVKGTDVKGKVNQSVAWMNTNPAAVVVPGTKSERPGLRSVRRRRSSFSAADVVA